MQMDVQSLGALLTALGGYFSAQAGAQAGQLQGLLMGEDITERRKRMKMAEEAHQEQMETMRLQRRLQEAEEQRRAELYPLQKDILSTQAEKGKIDLTNTRLWSLFQQGVAPSQITDPVLRAQYEPFFNFQMGVRSLEAVMTDEDLQAVLKNFPEDQRALIEILGRAKLFENQSRRQMLEKYMQGLDRNIAEREFQLRTVKLNTVINAILNNINNEGMDWDKRTPEQKIQAVQKWIKQLKLEDVVSPDFANMFQRVRSVDARQLALYRAQAELQHQFAVDLANRQYAHTLNLQREGWWSNIVAGAMGLSGGQGVGGVAPVGFMKPAPPPNIFTPTPDNNGSYLNQTALNNYLKPPIDVPVYYGNKTVMLSSLRGRVASIYNELGRPNGRINADDISTLITYDAGLQIASAQQAGLALDWNTALLMAVDNIIPILESNHLYRSSPDYQRVLNNWKRAWQQKLQQRAEGGGQSGGQTPAPNMPRGQIGNQPTAPASLPAQPRGGGGGSPKYTSSARRKRE
jgi:hypothetical protein